MDKLFFRTSNVLFFHFLLFLNSSHSFLEHSSISYIYYGRLFLFVPAGAASHVQESHLASKTWTKHSEQFKQCLGIQENFEGLNLNSFHGFGTWVKYVWRHVYLVKVKLSLNSTCSELLLSTVRVTPVKSFRMTMAPKDFTDYAPISALCKFQLGEESVKMSNLRGGRLRSVHQ